MKLIQKGSKGKDVTAWKRFLMDKGFLAEDQTSDLFDNKTVEASLLFQTEYGLYPDSKIGKNTILKAVELGFEKPKVFTRNIDCIIVHITANSNNLIGEKLLAKIDRDHRLRKFRKAGYQYIIDKEGNIIVGRTEDEIGAHCEGYNDNSIGICYDDRGDDHKPNAPYGTFMSEKQKVAYEACIKDVMIRHNIPADKVYGHNKLNAGKACPCFDSNSKEFKEAIKL